MGKYMQSMKTDRPPSLAQHTFLPSVSGSEIFPKKYKSRDTSPLAQIHLDVVIPTIVHKVDPALRSPCRIYTNSIDLGAVHR